MKRLSALLLCAVLLMTALEPAACAASLAGQTQTGGEAYVDTNGKAVWALNGAEEVLPYNNVKDIVYVGDMRVFLTAPTLEGATALFMWSPLLSTQDCSVLVSAVAGEPVYVAHDDAIYFLSAENSRQLMKCDTALSPRTSVVRLLPSANCVLREAMDGLNVSLASEDGEVYYSRVLDAASGMLRVTQFDPQAEWHNFGDFETQRTDEGGLELRRAGETNWRFITYDNVRAQAVMDGRLYYLTQELNGSGRLYSVDPASAAAPVFRNAIDRALQPTLCAGEGYVFVIDPLGTVQALQPGSAQIAGSWNAGTMNAEMEIRAGKLLVYNEQNGVKTLRLKADLPGSGMAQKTYTTLTMGSRGEDVRALQERLASLGYSAGRADGVFGANTRYAVIYFQDAVGMAQDGIATPELQQRLFASNAPVYQQYVELARGGRTGVRVIALQERLRELGYQADKADGVYGARTQTAVALFQTENGLRSTGIATVETQQRLMGRGAAVCSSYILLRKGDSGVRVVELQERLRELGYYAAEADGEFDDQLADTVLLFCKVNGLTEQMQADTAMQRVLFSRDARYYDGYIELWKGDTGEQVKRLQIRLSDLGYFNDQINGVYGSRTKDAVRLFQQINGLDADGVAGVLTQERLYSPWAIPNGVDPRYTPAPVPTPAPTGVQPTATPAPTPTPGPNEQNVDPVDLAKMIMWMDDNYYGYGDQDPWDEVSFVSWLQFGLYIEEFMPVEQYVLRQDGIYDLATKEAVEAFQRFYELDKKPEHAHEEYRYGVADGETLQLIWDMLPNAYKTPN